MNTFTRILQKNTKIEWVVCLTGISISAFFFVSEIIPRLITQALFEGFASVCLIYSAFLKQAEVPIKNRLIEAMFGGAFFWMFVESCSKIFSKWAVGMF
jgi:hypothetical protein